MGQVWNIGYITKHWAESRPEKNAVIFEDSLITYNMLNKRINQTAHYLQGLGLVKGDRIALFLDNCPEFIYLYFAAGKLGLILVPLNLRLVGPEIIYQLNDSGARALLFHVEYVEKIERIRERTGVEPDKYVMLPDTAVPVTSCPDWAVLYDLNMKGFSETEPIPDSHIFLDDPMGIIYTSGTTGNPKGAVISHNQTYFKIMSLSGNSMSDLVLLTQLPLFHSGGLFISLSICIGQGSTIVLRKKFDPIRFCLDIETYKANIVFAFATMWRFILDSGKLDEIDKSSILMAIGGGERTPITLINRLREKGIMMQTGFGLTENSAMTALSIFDIDRKPDSVGKAREWTDIWIEDDAGQRLPSGEIGEIVTIGPKVMSGYWNKPAETAKTIIDGALHTGDLGYLDEEGFLFVVDRKKDMYRSGGENVYPAQVENVLYEHSKIQNVAIIGVEDKKWGETGRAFIQPLKGESISLEEVHAFLEDKVARFKYPKYIELVEKMPITSSGKIKKGELKSWDNR